MSNAGLEVQFTGMAHDHMAMQLGKQQQQPATLAPNTNITNTDPQTPPQNQPNASALSTIAILRRHPMYDSLMLVKRRRPCLDGYSLEFPTSEMSSGSTNGNNQQQQPSQKEQQPRAAECCRTKLVSLYLDGDDPMYQCQEDKCKSKFLSDGEIVYVPMNGLLTRLDTYEKHGVAIDSRVYAFAMGLKTAEKFLQSSSMKELQETPPL